MVVVMGCTIGLKLLCRLLCALEITGLQGLGNRGQRTAAVHRTIAAGQTLQRFLRSTEVSGLQ